MLEVKRTLVKSGPELWAEVTDPAAIGRHLGPFGSVRITRVEPERLVEWEGDRARGAVRLEPSGFGTRVILTADTRPEAASAPEPDERAGAEPPKDGAATERLSVEDAVSDLEARSAPATEAEPAPAAEVETAEQPDVETAEQPEAETAAEPEAAEEPEAADESQPRGVWSRLFGRFGRRRAVPDPEPEPPVSESEPEPVATAPEPVAPRPEPDATEPPRAREPEPEAMPPAIEPLIADEAALAVLTETLDALGKARHRPFSRA